jgi:hypothetical protein
MQSRRTRDALPTSRIVRALAAAAAATVLAGCTTTPTTGGREPSPTVTGSAPAFALEVTRRDVVRTTTSGLTPRERADAMDAFRAGRSVLNQLYVAAFLDPAGWTATDRDDVLALFATDAGREAERRLAVLTAGPDAADRFDVIVARPSTVAFELMTDRAGAPIVISADVRFRALATGSAGRTRIRSDGRFLLQRVDGTWRIVAFRVSRSDAGSGVM